MKESVKILAGEKTYDLYFDIGDMRNMEREINRSILSLYTEGLLRNITIDVIVAAIRYGIHDEKHGKRTDEECYDIVQAFCDAGGDIDNMAGAVINAFLKSGLFGHYPKEKNKETEKETSSSTPSKNG